ncbi:MAG: HNH endonuclease, partial [Planctomycetota bacterium]
MKFELEKIYRNVPDDEIIADIKRVAAELGQDFLTMSQYGKHGKFDNSTPQRRFGSWSKATALAGLGKAKIQQNARLSDEELFKNLEEVWTKLGRQPRISEMASPVSVYSAAVYKRHFGSWMKALEIFVEY